MIIEAKKTTPLLKVNYELMKDELSPYEASEIVNELYAKKINFHEVKAFSQLIRFGDKEEATLERIEDLKHNRKLVNAYIEEAKEAGKSLRIHSTISIEFI